MDDDWEHEDMKLSEWLFFVLLGAAWILALVLGMFMMSAVLFL